MTRTTYRIASRDIGMSNPVGCGASTITNVTYSIPSSSQTVRMAFLAMRRLASFFEVTANTSIEQGALLGRYFLITFASILSLLFACSPSAILGTVRSIIVDALNSVLPRWGQSHISNEVFVVSPSLAYGNSSSTVISVKLLFWVGASLHHIVPSDYAQAD